MSSDSKSELNNSDAKSDVTSISVYSDVESGLKTESKTSESAIMNNTTASEDSEYETLEEDNGSSHSSGSRRSSVSEGEGEGGGSDPRADQREDGDGQEENSVGKDKKLDDDEDRRNPQYIPKKGTFYEHDDRTMMDENAQGEGVEPEEKPVAEEVVPPRKGGKVWAEGKGGGDRWTHDLYDETEQAPKSAQELIDTYGYDIRNEEAAPKARRRRRYGRGPNKYTRNWEDEDAYIRQTGGREGGGGGQQRRVFTNNKEDFPDLGGGGDNAPRRRKSKSPRSVPPQPPREPREEKVERPREGGGREPRAKPKPPFARRPPSPPPAVVASHTFTPSPAAVQAPPPTTLPTTPIVAGALPSEPTGRGRGRGFRGTNKQRPVEFAARGRGLLPAAFTSPPSTASLPAVDDSLKHAADMLVQDFSHIYVSSNSGSPVQSHAHAHTLAHSHAQPQQMIHTNIVEETIIPRSERRSHGGGGGGDGKSTSHGKRYSSQRQRGLAENTPPPTHHPPPAYSPPTAHNIPYYTQPPPNGYVPSGVYNEVGPPPPATVSSPPMQMVAFLPPPSHPPPSAAPPYPPPPLLTPHPHFMPPPAFQQIALQPTLPGQFEDMGVGVGGGAVAGAAEVFQSTGGITYYSTQTQSALPRATPPRRVKLAIPIVPPPTQPAS